MTTQPTSVVVGGSGAVGSLLSDLLRGDGDEVVVVDVASAAGHVRGDITNPNTELQQLLSRAHTVILAVPEQVALAADLDALRPDALLVETLSVKSRIAAARASAKFGQALGINPMFAPSLGMDGRPVAAVVHHPGPRVDAFLARLASWGASVVQVDADTHDRLAAATQALTHSSILSFGYALRTLDLSIDDISAIAPPPHATSLALLARIASGEPEVYWDVQAGNPYAGAARAALTSATVRLESVMKDGSELAFAEFVHQAGSPLGAHAAVYAGLCAELFGIVRESPAHHDGQDD